MIKAKDIKTIVLRTGLCSSYRFDLVQKGHHDVSFLVRPQVEEVKRESDPQEDAWQP